MLILSVLAVVLVIRLLLPYYVHPAISLEERKLAAIWEQRRKADPDQLPGQPAVAETGPPFYFDPNTLDSMGFIRLGLAAKTTHMLLNWRNKGKQFYHKEEFKALYTLSEQEYNRLAPFITIRRQPGQPYEERYKTPVSAHYPPLPDQIDLNSVDSATLVRMKGIGPFIAHKLLERRQALGGFTATMQLMEVFRFPDSTYQYLSAHFKISDAIRRLPINTATEEQLARHPYIGEKMAKNIILLRNGLIKFEKTTQLRQVPLMNEEKYRKIAPYCTID